jgi:lysophospholipase L1-like esterase
VSRSPWPLLIAIGVTIAVGIGSVATRDDRVPHPPAAITPAPVGGPAYVALGDSFTAGDAIGKPQPGPGSGHCLRSTSNYPSLIARELGYALTDVSCSGATTRGVLNQTSYEPAQISAVNAKTRLVTVSIGGNDLGTYTSMILTCLRRSRPSAQGAPCSASLNATLSAGRATIARRVGTVLDAIHDRAPNAKVLFITYIGLMPHHGTCAAAPFSKADVAWFSGIEDGLSGAVAKAAERHGVHVVDMHDLGRDHHVCSGAKAWVNGPRPRDDDGILFHPNGAGERATARAVINYLREAKS